MLEEHIYIHGSTAHRKAAFSRMNAHSGAKSVEDGDFL